MPTVEYATAIGDSTLICRYRFLARFTAYHTATYETDGTSLHNTCVSSDWLQWLMWQEVRHCRPGIKNGKLAGHTSTSWWPRKLVLAGTHGDRNNYMLPCRV